jgi:hypothetical protein
MVYTNELANFVNSDQNEITWGQISDTLKDNNIVNGQMKRNILNQYKSENNYIYSEKHVTINDCFALAVLIAETTIDICAVSDTGNYNKKETTTNFLSFDLLKVHGGNKDEYKQELDDYSVDNTYSNLEDGISDDTINNTLHYYQTGVNDEHPKLKNLNLSNDRVIKFKKIGYERYNTKLIRNIEWLTSMQLVIKDVINEQLRRIRKNVISANKFVKDDNAVYHKHNYRDGEQ